MNARLVRRRQRRRRFAISVIVFLAIVGFGGAYALHENQLPNIAPSTTISLTDSLVESKTVEPPAQANYLILVNAENPLSNVDEKFDIVSAYGVLPLAESDIMLEKNTLDALVLMFQAAEEEGIDDLIVSSGYRNERLQQQLYAEAIDKSYVQKPGYSEHQTGLAVDIAFNDVWAGGLMDDSWKAQWLAENAWRYGFILRYPDGKQDITGIAYEPWHFRYVGLDDARKIYESGFCLEEYLGK